MCFNFLVHRDVDEKLWYLWALSVCSPGNGLVVKNKTVYMSFGFSNAKAPNTPHFYHESSLWDTQTSPSSPIQELWGRRNKENKEISQDENQRDIFSNSFEISLAMPVFSLSKHDPQDSAVDLKVNLPFNLPPLLTFLQGLRNRCLWFGTPDSAVSLLCMTFMPLKYKS